MTDKITELVAELRVCVERGEYSGGGYTYVEVAPEDALAAANALEATVKEMHARELHHFEEEQKSARYRAAIEKAISWNTHDVHKPKFWDLHHILTRALHDGAADV